MASDESPATERAELPGVPESVWFDSSPSTDYPPLSGDLSVDTVVVGAGIAGITTAERLVAAGQDVAVLEADRIVSGVTGRTTAKLTSLHGLVYDQLQSEFGDRNAQRYAEANETAIDFVERQVERHDIDCSFERTPAYTYVEDPDQVDEIESEVLAARDLGLPASFTDSFPLDADVAGAVRFDDQARFHPRNYLLAQADQLTSAGGHIFERTRATDVDPWGGVEVETPRGTVAADQAVLATHFPVDDLGGYFTRMSPKRGYVLSVRLDDPAPEGLYYRKSSPYFSVRAHPTGDESRALVGGQNHRTGEGGDELERYRELERQARDHLDVAAVEHRWSTQDFTSVDSVPLVGKLAPATCNVYTATGFGGWGMTNGVAAGLLLADLVRGVDNDWEKLYTPTRLKPLASAPDFVDHNLESATKLVTDRLRLPTLRTPDLEPGEGTVEQWGFRPVGFYRDDDGERHAVAATCPHMGCVVDWNAADETWDCPCHGSRFEADGTVIDGPASADLKDLDL